MTFEEKVKLKSQVYEIMDLVLEGNGYEQRQREMTGTLPTFFVYFSGHVNTLTVDIHTDGWSSGHSKDKGFEFRLDNVLSKKDMDEFRAAVKASFDNKGEIETLRRDILRQEGKVKDEKDALAIMKRTLKRKERASGNRLIEEQPM